MQRCNCGETFKFVCIHLYLKEPLSVFYFIQDNCHGHNLERADVSFADIYLLAVAVDCISHAHQLMMFHGNFYITHSFVDVKHQVTLNPQNS
jgi:hypothetical protein